MNIKNKKKLGRDFEKEAFNYLKNVFDKVIWVSRKHHFALIDFVAYDKKGRRYLIEAKYRKLNKPSLKDSQKYYSDYMIYKIEKEGKIHLIKTKPFSNKVDLNKICPFIDFEKIERSRRNIRKKGLFGRYRPVCKYGKNMVIYLDEYDVVDFGLSDGDLVDIDDLVIVKKTKRGIKNE